MNQQRQRIEHTLFVLRFCWLFFAVRQFGGSGFAMLVESVSAVCQLVLALGCSLSATRDVVRHESKKCRRAMYNDFMVACPAQEVTRFRSFDRLGAKSPLGEGCVGVVYSVNGGGWQVAAKTAKERGPLGFAGNKAAVAKEIQLAMSVSAHPCLTQLLGWSVETTCASNRLFSIWDLVPTSPSMADALLEEASGASIFNLEGSLAFLADVLCHLQDHKFPAFDFHPVDMRVVCPKSGALRIIDWSGGFGLEGGNAAFASCVVACQPRWQKKAARASWCSRSRPWHQLTCHGLLHAGCGLGCWRQLQWANCSRRCIWTFEACLQICDWNPQPWVAGVGGPAFC